MSIPLIYCLEDIYIPVGTKEVVKTEQIWIDPSDSDILSDILSDLCHISKNLWNEANYVIRQLFTQKDKDGNNIPLKCEYI